MANPAPYFPLLLLFGLFEVWVGLQQLPLPIGWLQAIAPGHAAHFLTANLEATTATLSLDPNQTHIGFVKGLSYWCVLFLVLALVNTTQRLKTLAFAVVLTGTFQACYGGVLALCQAQQAGINQRYYLDDTTRDPHPLCDLAST